jgi:uncharacterized protein
VSAREPRIVAVTGASGLIGSALVASLQRDGQSTRRLVRRRANRERGEVEWDPQAGRIDAAALEGVHAVVHLAGESIDGRWTAAKKQRLRDSRIAGTRLLAETLASLSNPPEVLVSGSAVGIYGADRGDERLSDDSAAGDDFLGRLGVEWEAAASPAAAAGIRVAHPRFGVVLDRGGGALRRMLPAFRMGVAGRLGSGDQWMSWVTLEDAVRAIRFTIDTPALSGPFNACAPEPVTNSEFTEEMGRALSRPTLLVIPEIALHALFGEMADGTILASQRVHPDRLLVAGFEFRHPEIAQALGAVLHSGG